MKLLGWQIAGDILTTTIWALMSCSRQFKDLTWDTAMPDKSRQDGNLLIKDSEGIRQCYSENFSMYSVTLTCQQSCFRWHLPHHHSLPSRQGHDVRSLRTCLSLFFQQETHSSQAKDDKINYMTGTACLEKSGLLQQLIKCYSSWCILWVCPYRRIHLFKNKIPNKHETSVNY